MVFIDANRTTERSDYNHTCANRFGYTLLELILALSLFVVLLSMLWNIVLLFSRSQNQGTRLAERSQLVRSLAQLLEDDLKAAIQDPVHPHQVSLGGDDDVRRFGLSGTPQSLRIDVIEINPFATSAPRTRSARFGEIRMAGPRAEELKTVFYHFDSSQGLVRREIDFETPDVSAPGPEGSNLFAPEVIGILFRYYDGKNWSSDWESLDRGGLPVAIEATLRTLPLSEALRFRQVGFSGTSGEISSVPVDSVIVAYLPTSPVRKFEQYERKKPPKKEPAPMTFATPPHPMPSPVSEATPLPEEPVPNEQPPASQQRWIRGQ